jgi:hypothetical protein
MSNYTSLSMNKDPSYLAPMTWYKVVISISKVVVSLVMDHKLITSQ